MEIIPHRQLRNESSAVLARVSEGEVIGVTNNGKLAAVLTPPATRALERARRAGSVREARLPQTRFEHIERANPSTDPGTRSTTSDILRELRAER